MTPGQARLIDGSRRARRASARRPGLADVVARWPERSAPAIARNAWPARIARDGTLHVSTADSVWAFELGHQRGRDRRAARRRRASASRPARCREQESRGRRRRAARRRPPSRSARPPRARGRDRATKSCAKLCKKRSLFSLARARCEPPGLIHCRSPQNLGFAGLFLMATLSRQRRPTRRRTSRSSKASSRSGCARACTSARPASAASTTSSTRSSTTPSTRRWPGHNDSIDVTIHPDNSVTVRDRGRGIPVDVIDEQGLPGDDGRADEAPRRRQVRRRAATRSPAASTASASRS